MYTSRILFQVQAFPLLLLGLNMLVFVVCNHSRKSPSLDLLL